MNVVRVGAAFQLSDSFRAQPADTRDDGIMGFSPSASLRMLPKLGLDVGSQFMFDASGKELAFGDFYADPAYKWLTGAVQADLWVIPATLSARGAMLVDTGDSYLSLPDDDVRRYFAQWPEGTYERESDGVYFVDCDLRDPPRLEIDVGGLDVGLDGTQLRGPYDHMQQGTGRRLCFVYLEILRKVSPQDDGLGAILG